MKVCHCDSVVIGDLEPLSTCTDGTSNVWGLWKPAIGPNYILC